MITSIRHPEFIKMFDKWFKYRLAYEGGQAFIDRYLIKFSAQETDLEFQNRRRSAYCPAHAKSAIIDIRNSIYTRLIDITRTGGSDSYQDAVSGLNGGVDGKNTPMNTFIGTVVLPELLIMKKVGVYIDKPPLLSGLRSDSRLIKPYLYHYTADKILSWYEGDDNRLESVLLEDIVYDYYDGTKLPRGTRSEYRLYEIIDEGVLFRKLRSASNGDEIVDEQILDLKRIPFVIFEISNSLLCDIADYQIALLNLGSSDLNYALKSNFPFYTEQYVYESEYGTFLKSDDGTPDTTDTKSTNGEDINIGITKGRKYARGLDRPGFIHPSSEPLTASMKKQEVMKAEIRELVNLALSMTEAVHASKESKEEDKRSLEAGLAYIGLELERGESSIGEIWSEYEGTEDNPSIKYPKKYEYKTDDSRRKAAKELIDIMATLPSLTFQKQVAKEIIVELLSGKVDETTLAKAFAEIDKSKVINIDPEVIINDHKEGLVSTETACEIRGYPDGEAKKAEEDHIRRVQRLMEAQMAGSITNAASRGVKDLDPNSKSASEEKELSRNTDLAPDTKDRVRGKGEGNGADKS